MRLAAFALLGALLPSPVLADARFAVAHITNNTNREMTFYGRWVWNHGTPWQRVHIDWKMKTILPGETFPLRFPYDGSDMRSPDLVVMFDSRSRGEHWEMVKLAQGPSPDYWDRNFGFTYALEYDNNRMDYASLRAKNGGTVTILDRRAFPPRINGSPWSVRGDARFAVAHITNNTNREMTFYSRWVWNHGTPWERVHIDWRMKTILPGETFPLRFPYDGSDMRSPDLVVMFDSRSRGEHWEMVKLVQGPSPDYWDRNFGFTYALEYDNNRMDYASLRAKNGGTVTILDRRASPPQINAQEGQFRRW